jgi:hypothetical protein
VFVHSIEDGFMFDGIVYSLRFFGRGVMKICWDGVCCVWCPCVVICLLTLAIFSSQFLLICLNFALIMLWSLSRWVVSLAVVPLGTNVPLGSYSCSLIEDKAFFRNGASCTGQIIV